MTGVESKCCGAAVVVSAIKLIVRIVTICGQGRDAIRMLTDETVQRYHKLFAESLAIIPINPSDRVTFDDE